MRRRVRGQTSNHSRNNGDRNGPWGDPIPKQKETGKVRFAFQNINGLPVNSQAAKHKNIQHILEELQIDYYGMSEVNLNFPKINRRQQWKDRFPGKFHSYSTNNEHSNSKAKRLFGGNGCILSNQLTNRVIKSGADETGLGRWVWTLIQGKQGIRLRIITGYRPVTDRGNNANTVFSQHEKYFHDNKQIRDPRKAFLEDLEQAVKTWMDNGEQIILGLDLNEDTWSSNSAILIETWGLMNAHKSSHPDTTKTSTCNKNNQEVPIDGIWISPGIDIAAAGMSGFEEYHVGKSDHRMLWIEVLEESIFGFQASTPKKRDQNKIPLNDPKVTKKINKYLLKERERHRIPQKLFALEKKAQQKTFYLAEQKEYDRLFQLDFNLRNKARKKCVKFYAGNVPFSDVIAKDRKEIHLWDLIFTKLKKRRADTRKTRRLMKQTDQPTALRMTFEEATIAQAKCKARYQKHKKQKEELRKQFQKKVNARRAKHFGTTIEAQEKLTKSTRQQKSIFGRIRRVLDRKPYKSLTTVTYQDEFGTEHECNSKETVEEACMTEGKARYTQVYPTPFTQGSLLHDLGFLANTPASEKILEGTYKPAADVNVYTRRFIQELKQPPGIIPNSINGRMTTQQHISSWKKMKKTTSSSPFGPSFTELIAACDEPKVADIDACFASIPLYSGFCPKSWSKMVDIMIPKKQDSIDVAKLRIIVLFDAMFNLLNKNIGRDMVAQAEAMGLIPTEAYGSRKGHRASDCALNKVLVNDIIRQRAMTAALCSNDAKSCYDRIVHAVATLCMRRLGVSPEACQVMFGTLEQVEHYVATAYGTSDTKYTALEFPLQGVLQGNGAGPAIWLVTSIPLINMLKTQGFGFKSRNPISKEGYHIVCFTFVDDTDTVHSPADPTAPMSTLLREMQAVLDNWEGGLKATGGALAPDKCFWYSMTFHWNTTSCEWEYDSIAEQPGSIQIKNTQGQMETLKRLEVSNAKESLGVWIAMDGNQKQQTEALLTKVDKWAAKIKTRQLTKTEAWLSLQTGIAKGIGYPVSTTSLSKAQCNEVMKPLLDNALPALGVPRRFPKTLLFSSTNDLGLAISHLWDEQGHAKIDSCLRNGSSPSSNSTGLLLRDVLSGIKVELGLPGDPLSYDYKKYHLCSTDTYFDTIWEFCHDHQLSLRDGSAQWRIYRQNDLFLMQEFEKANLSPKTLRILNKCRQTLKVIRLSDITTGDGESLLFNWNTPHFNCCNNNELDWRRQGKLTKHHWQVWTTSIIKIFVNPLQPKQFKLLKPLGNWTDIPAKWPWFVSTDGRELFKRISNKKFEVYHREGRTRRPRYSFQFFQENLPAHCKPTCVSGDPYLPQHTGSASTETAQRQEETKWWSKTYTNPTDLAALITGIQQGTAVCVTDGSFKQARGTAAYILKAAETSLDEAIYVNQTPGTSDMQDAYRAELAGIYGSIQQLTLLAREAKIAGTATMVCDCIGALQNVFEKTKDQPSSPHSDLLQATRKAVKDSHLHWKWQHVKGHQDDKKKWKFLTPLEQLNVRMDGIAKSYWQVTDALQTPTFDLPADNTWSIWWRGRRLSTWTTKQTKTIIYSQSTQQFWQRRNHAPGFQDHVDWPSASQAYKSFPFHKRLWFLKWSASYLPIGKNLKRWKIQDIDTCPRCGQSEDDRFHVIRCPHPEAKAMWTKKVNHLTAWFDTTQTAPDLKQLMLQGLESWYNQEIFTLPSVQRQDTNHLLEDQSLLGWDYLPDGRLSTHWAATQQLYFDWIGKKNTGKRWMTSLLKHLWSISWDLWWHRHGINDTSDSKTLEAIHDILDTRLEQQFEQQANQPFPRLNRWFSQPLGSLKQEDEDFKRQWLEAVLSARNATETTPATD